MNFEQEYQLEQFREIQNQYFDKEGNCYTGVNLSPSMMERMLKLINVLSERQTTDKTQDQPTKEALNIGNVMRRFDIEEMKLAYRIGFNHAKACAKYQGDDITEALEWANKMNDALKFD